MEWLKDKAQIVTRNDGSFVIQALLDGKYEPYNATPDYCPELYAEVVAFLEAPEA